MRVLKKPKPQVPKVGDLVEWMDEDSYMILYTSRAAYTDDHYHDYFNAKADDKMLVLEINQLSYTKIAKVLHVRTMQFGWRELYALKRCK